MTKHYKLLIVILLIPFLGFSNDDTFISKQKNIKKTYVVNSNAGIDIDNRYGNITVSTWDENKIDVDISIKVSGGNENWVNEKLSSIDVDITALKSMVTALTKIGNSALKSKGSSNSFEINYVLKIPKNGTVKISNKYGNITTVDLQSNTDITCKYGKINLSKLNGNTNHIQIEYCQNSTIDYIKSGMLEARYSNLKINTAGHLNLDTNYSDLSILEGQNIKYDCNYSTFKFQKIGSIEGSGNYLTVGIGEISNSVTIATNYSKINIAALLEKTNNINITSRYSDVALGYTPNYAFDFTISTKYGNIKKDNDLQIGLSDTKSSTKKLSGYNKNKGQNKLTVSSSYGNISLLKKSINQ
jgi:hypothetical protein